MIDAKLKNGDLTVDSAGSVIQISGKDALFQRAVICMTVPKGSFIYDRKLGTERVAEDDGQRTAQLFGEALAEYPDTTVRVVSISQEGVAAVRVTVDGESRIEEVRKYGNV